MENIGQAPLIRARRDIYASSVKKDMEMCQHEEETCQKMKKMLTSFMEGPLGKPRTPK